MTGDLLNSPADIVAHLLEDSAYVNFPEDGGDWQAFIGQMPDEPDTAIGFYDTAGDNEGRSHVTGETFAKYGVQLRARSLSPLAGWLKMKDIKVHFDTINRLTVYIGEATYLVQAVHRRGEIVRNGKEPESNRFIHTLNVIVTVRLTSTTGTGT